ncbi:hypothetical protein ZWY2020_045682 [Hordeum vulgare]|nr:hypothetical protein ZWY2020_045682 [Hordeum vulgare]
MAGGIVTVASGVMNPLIGKLTALMGDEYNKLKGVRKQASFLNKELSAMNAALHKLELMDDELDLTDDDLDPSVKDWRDDVREMSYDMENCIDDFMRQSRADHAKAGFIKITARRIKELRQRLRIAHRMEELKTLAIEANDRRQRYKIDEWKPASGPVPVDPRLKAVYKEVDTLVGIDGPREEVATRLLDTHKKLKVVSIFGFGGLGKTTLAKQVYDKISSQFDCKAFFSVSQRPDMTELLNNLQLKLKMKDPDSSRTRKVDDIIEEIREHLKKKSLGLRVEETSTEEFHLLGELPSLVKLTFMVSHIPKEKAILGMGLFPVLEFFEFLSEEDAMAYLGFEAGAMPNLQFLNLINKEWGGDTPVGMEHLLRIQRIFLHRVDSGDATIVSAFRNALSGHPNCPSVHWTNW